MGGFVSRKRQYHLIRPGDLEERIECVINHIIIKSLWQASKCGKTYNCFLDGYFDNNKRFNVQGPNIIAILCAFGVSCDWNRAPEYGRSYTRWTLDFYWNEMTP